MNSREREFIRGRVRASLAFHRVGARGGLARPAALPLWRAAHFPALISSAASMTSFAISSTCSSVSG